MRVDGERKRILILKILSLMIHFCDVSENNFTLQNISPCVGTGSDGTDIGAFGVGYLRPSQWSNLVC